MLLPALLPSWGFFDVVAPSPRVHYQLLDEHLLAACEWREFRPRPSHVSLPTMLCRLLWNAQWNESLFLTSCAERIVQGDRSHSENEILARIARDCRSGANMEITGARNLRFRLVFVHREQQQLIQEVHFISRTESLPDAAV